MISLIVAIAPGGIIGKDNLLPWHYPNDLKYFKEKTLNKPIVMGFNTYLSIYERLGQALPKRTNYVLTYEDKLPSGGTIIKNLEDFLENFPQDDELFVIGGKMVYEMSLPYVDKLYITRIKQDHEGNVFFPKYDESLFELVDSVDTEELIFETYMRIKK